MPHIAEKFRPLIRKDLTVVSKVGDINFAYSALVYIPMWVAAQRYSTIDKICEIGLGTFFTEEVKKLDLVFRKRGFTPSQIGSAKFNSYLEFYRLVAVNYEDKARLENGCVYAGVPFATQLTKPVVPTSLVPNAHKRGRKKINVK